MMTPLVYKMSCTSQMKSYSSYLAVLLFSLETHSKVIRCQLLILDLCFALIYDQRFCYTGPFFIKDKVKY